MIWGLEKLSRDKKKPESWGYSDWRSLWGDLTVTFQYLKEVGKMQRDFLPGPVATGQENPSC